MNNPGPFPQTLPVTGALAVAVLPPVVPRVLQAANDNHEPDQPPAAAAPIPCIGRLFLFDLSEIFRPPLRVAAA